MVEEGQRISGFIGINIDERVHDEKGEGGLAEGQLHREGTRAKEHTPGSTSPLKKAKASELMTSSEASMSLCFMLSRVWPRFGHFIICAKRRNILICRFFNLKRRLTVVC